MSIAPNYSLVLAARVVCALAHGVFWSVLPAVAASINEGARLFAHLFRGSSPEAKRLNVLLKEFRGHLARQLQGTSYSPGA